MAVELRSVDLETTDEKEVVEVGWTDLLLLHNHEYDVGHPTSRLHGTEKPIGPQSMGVHHITDDMVKGLDRFDAKAFCNNELVHIAHYAEHELEYLPLDGRLICTYKLVRTFWPELEHFGLQFLKYHMQLHVRAATHGREGLMLPAHRAAPDSYVAALIFELCCHEYFARNPACSVREMVQEFLKITVEPLMQLKIGFGEHKGKLWTEVPDSYLQWILFPRRPHTKPFDADVIHTATQIKLSRRGAV